MTLQEFKTTLTQSSPPASINKLLQAMWFDAKDDWEAAHNIAQEIHTREGSWIHAYLHRKEGDTGNASYWYHKANKNLPRVSLTQEWEDIVTDFLAK
jgi:hypothetical protein